MIEEAGLTYADFLCGPPKRRELVRLRSQGDEDDWQGVTREALSPPDGPRLEAIRDEVERVNAAFARAHIEVAEHKVMASDRMPPDPAQRFAYRVFSETLDGGGRLYGPFWIGMRKDDRTRAIRLDREPIAELDFGQMNLRIMYAEEGARPPDGDLYAIPGLETACRAARKKLVAALVSSRKPLGRFPKGLREHFPKGMRVADAVALVAAKHPSITFGSQAWPRLQRAESDIIIAVVLECQRRGFAALPIHDGLLVPQSKAAEAKTVMEAAFRARLHTPYPAPVRLEDGGTSEIEERRRAA
jgi:hypothetical protein